MKTKLIEFRQAVNRRLKIEYGLSVEDFPEEVILSCFEKSKVASNCVFHLLSKYNLSKK